MLEKEGTYWENLFYGSEFTLLLLLLCIILLLPAGCAKTETINREPLAIPILKKWSGDYPVSELGRLPEGQQESAAGYIGDIETFIKVWRAFMPKEILPAVDFSKNIVLFTRNVQYYNRTSILKVEFQDGTAEILAMETMSALPIEKKVAMALAVIPRDGVKAVKAGAEKVQVLPDK